MLACQTLITILFKFDLSLVRKINSALLVMAWQFLCYVSAFKFVNTVSTTVTIILVNSLRS